jgi:hypothetical protein
MNARRICIRNQERKRPVGTLRLKQDDNIKMGVREDEVVRTGLNCRRIEPYVSKEIKAILE